ncbi:MAG: T9SS type A sorting domain-containing protein [Bacteroidales bacterium]|nr:T9SS type A sorting domain-containing protein [Bacteroidales bacterium]
MCPHGRGNAGTISGTTNICGVQNGVTYTVPVITNATSYIWTLPSGATDTSNTNSITVDYGTSAVSGNITVMGHNSCGDGAGSSLAITVNPTPANAGTITGSTTVCQGQNSVTYTVPAIANATSYIWTLPTGVTGTSTTNSITVNYGTSAVSGNITVMGHNSCGDGAGSSLAITVNPTPANAGTITGSTTVCQGQNSVTYTIPAIANATSYIWTLPLGATGTSTTNSITVNYGTSAVSGNITVMGHNSCGNGTSSSLAITVSTLPGNAGTITGSTTVCQGQNSVTYTVPAIANATSYIWTLPSGATGTSTTNSITVNYGTSAVTGNITVKGHNTCGDGTSSSQAITVNTLPGNAGTISGATTVCPGQNSVTYTVPIITDATSYVWTLPNGATGSSSTNSITVNYGSSAISGSIAVMGHNACGDGASSAITITVNTLPSNAGTLTGTTTVCQGQNGVTYTAPAISGATSYIWTLPTGATGTSTTNSITVDYGTSAVSGNITVQGHNSCGDGSTSNLAITVNSLPANAGVVSGPLLICQGQNAVPYFIPVIPGATSYVWTLPSGVTGTSSTNSIFVDFGYSAVSGNITVCGTNTCGNGSSSSLAITVTAPPANAGTITGATNVCQGQNGVIYTVPAITGATSYFWTLPNGAYGTSSTNTIIVNYDTNATNGNITVMGHNSCATGVLSNLYINVNPVPSTPTISIDINNTLLTSDAPFGNQWYINNTLLGDTNQTHTVTAYGNYYVIVTINGCSSDTSNVISVIHTGTLFTEKSSCIITYPNPAKDKVYIIATDLNNNKTISIHNIQGQLLLQQPIQQVKTEIDISAIAKGIYFIKVDSEAGSAVRRFVKE